jgi:hypothetical protein
MAKLFFVLLFIGAVFAQKTEEVQLTLTFETPQKVPALFTSIGDHVVMTIKEWTTTAKFNNGSCFYLDGFPKKYATPNTSVYPIYVINGDYEHGFLAMNHNTTKICPAEGEFNHYFDVGFADLTVTYAIK